MCSVLFLASRCSVGFQYEEGIERLGDSSPIWDGISGTRDRAEVGQGWLGGVSSFYHEPRVSSLPRVDMESRFNRGH